MPNPQHINNLPQLLPDIIYQLDPNGNIVYVNEGVRAYGYTPEELIGQSIFTLIHTSDKDKARYRINERRTGDRSTHAFEIRLLTKKSQTIPFEVKSNCLTQASFVLHAEGIYEGDEFRGTLGVARDITERKQIEKAFQKTQQELEEQRVLAMRNDRLRALGEMAAGMAHELNQPLMGVRGVSEHVLIGFDRGWNISRADIREKLEQIVEQVDRMSHIINHIRTFARDAAIPNQSPVNLNKVVKSATGLLNEQCKSQGISLNIALSNTLPIVSANEYSLEEVVINLITNARDSIILHQTSPLKSNINISTHTDVDDCATIKIADTGPGIPTEILPKIFDPFFTTKAPDKGTGLGLPISKSIVESFNGHLDIQTSSQGTMAIITLPKAS